MSFFSCSDRKAVVNNRGNIEVHELGPAGKILVLAPHPDDEVFAVGGLMSLMTCSGYDATVLAVTDGEASHAESKRVTRAEIRKIRLAETRRAYRELGINPIRVRMGIPDSQVCQHEGRLRRELEGHLDGASLVLAPIESDGHPDHNSVGHIARVLTASSGLPLWRYAVWARLHQERIAGGLPLSVLLPEGVALRMRCAVQEYSSQFNALGPDPEDGPVLPADFEQHFIANKEFLWPAN